MADPIIVCTWERGRRGVPAGVEETLSFARGLAAGAGFEVRWAVVGPAPERMEEVARKHGVARVDCIDDPRLAEFQPDLCVEALVQYCRQARPKLVLVPQTFEARVVAPRLSVRIGAGVVMNALEIVADGNALKVITSGYGGNTRVEYELAGTDSCVIGVLADVLLARAPEEASCEPVIGQVAVDLGGIEERVRVVKKAHFEGPRLEDAQIIVAGGMGLASRENFRLVEDLAEALGGMAGASRPAVENGWADASRQVGLTGKITRPVLYLGAGISGASQHMVGCSAAKTIVAINTNPDAAIFRYARYGIVSDAMAVLPEITKAVKET